jgi:phosphatidylglycerophosphate synthase
MSSDASSTMAARAGNARGPWLGVLALLWAVSGAGAVVAAALDRAPIAAAGLLVGTACLALERARIRRSPASDPRREQARALPLVAGEAFLAAATALAVAHADTWAGRDGAAPWLAWIAGFSVVVQGYTDVVFARSVRGTGLAEAQELGARRADGSVLGLADPLPLWARIARAPVVALPPALAAYLLAGRPIELLWIIAVWFGAGLLFVSLLRGRVMWQIEAGVVRPPPSREPLDGSARWARLRAGLEAARDDAFWGLVVARPLAAVALYPIADIRWLTPNVVTVISIACCLVAGALGAMSGTSLAVIAVALIFCRSVLDSLDGQLARYRALSSHFGGYFDKASDAFGWAALYAAAAASGYAATRAPWALLVPLVGVTALSFQGITYWLDRDLRTPGTLSQPTGRSPLSIAGWLRNLWRIVLFEEPDYYLWISLGLLTGLWEEVGWLIGLPYSLRVTALSIRRLVHARSVWVS